MTNQASIAPLRIGTLYRFAAGHPFFDGWSLEQLKHIEPFSQMIRADQPTRLLELGELCPYEFLLMEGAVSLEPEIGARGAARGPARIVRSGELDAGFPLAHLRPSQYRVTAHPGAQVMRVESSRLKRFQEKRRQARFHVTDEAVAGSWRSHSLVTRVIRQMRGGNLEIPPMPAIAVKIRRALEKDDYSMAGIASIVSADPAIAGRLIRVANSALFGGSNACLSVQDALVRLGVQRAQNIVFSLATKNLFAVTSPPLKELMLKRWRHAIDIAALSAVLAKLTPGLDGDRGLLLGLLHDIGALPVIHQALDFPDLARSPGMLEEIVTGLAPEVSAVILEQWGFSGAFRDAAVNQSNWYRAHEGSADYTDVLVVAHLHALVKERSFHRLPRLDETPAFQKLALGLLSPQLSLLS